MVIATFSRVAALELRSLAGPLAPALGGGVVLHPSSAQPTRPTKAEQNLDFKSIPS